MLRSKHRARLVFQAEIVCVTQQAPYSNDSGLLRMNSLIVQMFDENRGKVNTRFMDMCPHLVDMLQLRNQFLTKLIMFFVFIISRGTTMLSSEWSTQVSILKASFNYDTGFTRRLPMFTLWDALALLPIIQPMFTLWDALALLPICPCPTAHNTANVYIMGCPCPTAHNTANVYIMGCPCPTAHMPLHYCP